MGIVSWDEFIYNNGHSITIEVFREISVVLMVIISEARVINMMVIDWRGVIFK